MKKLVILSLVLGLLMLAGCDESTAKANPDWKDGTYEATVEGQAGPMVVDTVVEGGYIKSVTIVSNHETEGVADKALEQIPAAIVAANSTEVDSIAGCTYSSGRIKDAVSICLDIASGKEVAAPPAEVFVSFDAPEGTADGEYIGTAKGFGGDVTLTVIVASGKVTAIDAVGASETAGVGSKALDAAKLGNIDGVAGATVTSTAVKDAYAAAFAQDEPELEPEETEAEPETKPETKPESAGPADGTYSASAKGFGGDVTVTVTISGGKVTAIEAVGASETAGVGSKALDAANSGNIDGVSGATVTSNAVKEAYNAAVAKAG